MLLKEVLKGEHEKRIDTGLSGRLWIILIMDINKSRLYLGIAAIGSIIGATIFLAYKYSTRNTKTSPSLETLEHPEQHVEEIDTLANRLRQDILEINGNYPTPQQLDVLAAKMGAYMEERLFMIENADYTYALNCRKEGATFSAYLALLLKAIKTKPAKIGLLQQEQLDVLNSFALAPERTIELARTLSRLISENQRKRVNETYLNMAQISLRAKTDYLLREWKTLGENLVEASKQWEKQDLVFLPQVLSAHLNQEAIESNPGLINCQLEITIAADKYEQELKEDTDAWEQAISPLFQRIIALIQ